MPQIALALTVFHPLPVGVLFDDRLVHAVLCVAGDELGNVFIVGSRCCCEEGRHETDVLEDGHHVVGVDAGSK